MPAPINNFTNKLYNIKDPRSRIFYWLNLKTDKSSENLYTNLYLDNYYQKMINLFNSYKNIWQKVTQYMHPITTDFINYSTNAMVPDLSNSQPIFKINENILSSQVPILLSRVAGIMTDFFTPSGLNTDRAQLGATPTEQSYIYNYILSKITERQRILYKKEINDVENYEDLQKIESTINERSQKITENLVSKINILCNDIFAKLLDPKTKFISILPELILDYLYYGNAAFKLNIETLYTGEQNIFFSRIPVNDFLIDVDAQTNKITTICHRYQVGNLCKSEFIEPYQRVFGSVDFYFLDGGDKLIDPHLVQSTTSLNPANTQNFKGNSTNIIKLYSYYIPSIQVARSNFFTATTRLSPYGVSNIQVALQDIITAANQTKNSHDALTLSLNPPICVPESMIFIARKYLIPKETKTSQKKQQETDVALNTKVSLLDATKVKFKNVFSSKGNPQIELPNQSSLYTEISSTSGDFEIAAWAAKYFNSPGAVSIYDPLAADKVPNNLIHPIRDLSIGECQNSVAFQQQNLNNTVSLSVSSDYLISPLDKTHINEMQMFQQEDIRTSVLRREYENVNDEIIYPALRMLFANLLFYENVETCSQEFNLDPLDFEALVGSLQIYCKTSSKYESTRASVDSYKDFSTMQRVSGLMASLSPTDLLALFNPAGFFYDQMAKNKISPSNFYSPEQYQENLANLQKQQQQQQVLNSQSSEAKK